MTKLRRGKIQDHSDERYLSALAAAEDREAWKARALQAEEALREAHSRFVKWNGAEPNTDDAFEAMCDVGGILDAALDEKP